MRTHPNSTPNWAHPCFSVKPKRNAARYSVRLARIPQHGTVTRYVNHATGQVRYFTTTCVLFSHQMLLWEILPCGNFAPVFPGLSRTGETAISFDSSVWPGEREVIQREAARMWRAKGA